MESAGAHSARLALQLPVQRGDAPLSNPEVLNGVLSVAGHGRKWRARPVRFGNGHAICTRMNRWSKNGVLDRLLGHAQREPIVRIRLEAVALGSTIVKVRPGGTGPCDQTVRSPSAATGAAGPPRLIRLPRVQERP